jgi:hypothetical protein
MLMKTRFVADGAERLRTNDEFQRRLRELRESIREEYAAELATAGFFRRCVVHWRMAAEYRRQRRRIVPSPRSLYAAHHAADRSVKA